MSPFYTLKSSPLHHADQVRSLMRHLTAELDDPYDSDGGRFTEHVAALRSLLR